MRRLLSTTLILLFAQATSAYQQPWTMGQVLERADGGAVSPVTFSLAMDGSGISNLESDLTINGQTVSPTFRYEGKNATTGTWTATVGEDLTGAGTGGTVGLDTPFISDDEAVNGEGTRYWQAGNTTFGDVSTEDIVIEAVFAGGTTAINGRLISKYQSPAGWTLLQANPSAVTLYIKGTAGANVASQAGVVVPGVWNHIIIFCDKSGSGQMYLNGAASGAAVSLSSVGSVAQTMTNLTVAADPNGVNKHDATLAYAAMWQRDNWLDTHLQEDIAKERFYKLSGIYPAIAEGKALPESYTRTTVAHLDKTDGAGVRSLFQVGSGWPRIAQRTDSEGTSVTGYLTEAASTNLMLYSHEFDNAGWSKVRLDPTTPIDANSIIAPDGSLTADTIREDGTAANSHFLTATFTQSAVKYVTSVWVKAANRSWVELSIYSPTDGFASAYFDLSAGAVGTESANDDAGVEPYGNSWFRCWISDTRATAETGTIYIHLADADNSTTFDGLSQDSIYLWGAQVENVGYPTSYIATSGSSATRNGDVLYYKGDDGNVANNQQGTMVADVLLPNANGSISATISTLSDGGSSSNRLLFYTTGIVPRLFTAATAGDGGSVVGTTRIFDGVRHVARTTYQNNELKLFVDGVEEGTNDLVVTIPDDLDRINIGTSNTGGSGLGGIVSNIQILNRVQAP